MTKQLFWLITATASMLLAIGCKPSGSDTEASRPSMRARSNLQKIEQQVAANQALAADSLLVDEIEFFDQHEMFDELKRALLLRADLLLRDGKRQEATTNLLRAASLAEGLSDDAYFDQVSQRLRSDVDSTLNPSLIRELLNIEHRTLRLHSFGDDKFSFTTLWSSVLVFITLGCLLFYKIRLDNQLQLEKIKRLREQIAHRDASEILSLNQLREDEVVKRFRESFIRQTSITNDDWSALRKRFNELYPSFEKKLRDIHSLSDVEWQVCMLLKLDFSPSDISALTARSQATISTIRSRLYAKFFLQKGSASDWDRFIASL